MQGCVNALRYLARKANLDVTDNAGNNGRALAAGEEPPHQNVLNLLDELANGAGAAAADAEAESDEEITVGKIDDPMAHVPHARCNCRVSTFITCSVPTASHPAPPHVLANNMEHCSMCYCFVCDVEASRCTSWKAHCVADDVQKHWLKLRKEKKDQGKSGIPLKIGRKFNYKKPTATLPAFMSGLPHETNLPRAPAGYKAVTHVPVPAGVPTWPRLAGSVDIFMRKCVMHTHASLPMNAYLNKYFSCKRGECMLIGADGTQSNAAELIEAMTKLQKKGCIQIKWEINQCVMPHFPSAVAHI